MRQQPSMYSLAASCHSEGINAHCTATGRTWTVLSEIDTQPHHVLSGAADLACSQRVAEAECCAELSFTLILAGGLCRSRRPCACTLTTMTTTTRPLPRVMT